MRFLKSLSYALQGIRHCVKTQCNFRFHIVAGVSVGIVSFFYEFTPLEALAVAFTIAFVLICEMINTAVESLSDTISQDYDEHIKIAKDVGAGAVLLSAINAVIVAFALFWDVDKILNILNFFVSKPYLWIAVALYGVLSVCFVAGVFTKEKDNG